MAFHCLLLYLYYLHFLSDLHIFATNLATELIQKLSKSIHFHNSAHIFRFLLLKGFFSYQYLTGTSERLDVFIHVVEVIVDLLNLKFNMVRHGSTTKTLRYFERIDDTFQSLSINRKTMKRRNWIVPSVAWSCPLWRSACFGRTWEQDYCNFCHIHSYCKD